MTSELSFAKRLSQAAAAGHTDSVVLRLPSFFLSSRSQVKQTHSVETSS